ncbi:hypothetical protein [Halarchaeum salinum]|uniref:Cdc6 C-terminal domain-containing protein n=1 Tax=Halarchaeum salinum TaxID=489912 RepID=A0AAV3S6W8_9EURY
MHSHLDEMEMLGIITTEKRNEGSTGGQYKQIALNQDLDAVLKALKQTIDVVGVQASVQPDLPNMELSE